MAQTRLCWARRPPFDVGILHCELLITGLINLTSLQTMLEDYKVWWALIFKRSWVSETIRVVRTQPDLPRSSSPRAR